MAGIRHSTSPGVSRYPIRPGAVFLLSGTKIKKDPIQHQELEYQVFIWILGIQKKSEGIKWAKREVRLVRFEAPVDTRKRQFFIEPVRIKIKWENACRLLNKGFREIGVVPFNYNAASWTAFYKTIGYTKR